MVELGKNYIIFLKKSKYLHIVKMLQKLFMYTICHLNFNFYVIFSILKMYLQENRTKL